MEWFFQGIFQGLRFFIINQAKILIIKHFRSPHNFFTGGFFMKGSRKDATRADSKDYKECPKCGNDQIDKRGNIWYCYRCGHEW